MQRQPADSHYCLSRSRTLSTDHMTEDLSFDTMQVRDDHTPVSTGGMRPEPVFQSKDTH